MFGQTILNVAEMHIKGSLKSKLRAMKTWQILKLTLKLTSPLQQFSVENERVNGGHQLVK